MKKLIKLLILFLFLIAGNTDIYAQVTITVTGTVTDQLGQSVAGATALVKGTNIGTLTDPAGRYSLQNVAPDATLSFSFIGTTTQEILLNGRTTLNVTLVEEAVGLNEVIVVGYGTQKKVSITGAISGVTAKDLDRVHAGSTVSSALAGKMAGVSFRMPDGRPGASAAIQIRNMGSPLYVIDGIQQDAGQFNNISPNDIESITVMKDASAAIYGVRAANGVVVVTTKRGVKGSRNVVNVDAYTGWQNWSRFPNVVNDSYA